MNFWLLILSLFATPSAGVALNWQTVSTPSPWTARDAQEVFIWDDRLWLTGGLTGVWDKAHNQVNYWDMPHWNDLWSSKDGEMWQREAEHLSFPPRRSLSVVSFKDKLWMLGGWSSLDGYKSDVWTSTNGKDWQWLVSAAPWKAREGQTLTVFNNELWLLGGVNFDTREVFHDIWSSVDGFTWQWRGQAPWSGRYDHAVEVFDNRLWLTGGLDTSGEGKSDTWASVDGLSWTLVDANALWGKRHGHELLAIKDRLWLVSGWNTTADHGSAEVWLSKDGVFWEKTADTPKWLGREDHAIIFFRDKLWLMGGMADGFVWRNDIWSTAVPEIEIETNP